MAADDVVTVIGPDGQVDSEAHCGFQGISYQPAVDLLTRFQTAVRVDDRRAAADLVIYPLRWSGSPIADREDFLAQWRKIFTSEAAAEVAGPDPRGLFCSEGSFSMGSGVVWGTVLGDGRYVIVSLNV